MGFREALSRGFAAVRRAPSGAIGEVRVFFANTRARYFPRGAVTLKADKSREGSPPPDPAKLFSNNSEAEIDRHLPLAELLRESARNINARRGDLASSAYEIAYAVDRRHDGVIWMVSWSLCMLVAAAWLFIAGQLVLAALGHAPAHIIGLGSVEPADFERLARMFALAGVAGGGAAFLGALIVFMAGTSDDGGVRRKAGNFGAISALLAQRFDRDLNESRSRMDAHRRPEDAITDLSRAHVTALEARVFFDELGFLTEDQDALQRFRGYVMRRAGGGGSGGGDIRSFAAGMIVGAAIMGAALAPKDMALGIPVIADLGNQSAQLWILLGAFVYLLIPALVEFFRGPISKPFINETWKSALEAARSGFVGNDPPRVENVIQRIIDALEVYKARVRSAGDSAHHAAESVPTWRKAPEGPRFVATSFPSAPKPFLADPKSRKK